MGLKINWHKIDVGWGGCCFGGCILLLIGNLGIIIAVAL